MDEPIPVVNDAYRDLRRLSPKALRPRTQHAFMMAGHSDEAIHKTSVLASLYMQTKEGELCDITIKTAGEELGGHLCVLIISSGYFKGLYEQREISDTKGKVVDLSQLDTEAIKEIHKFMYLGSLEITNQNVGNILEAADFLLVSSVITKARNFMMHNNGAKTCVNIMLYAKNFDYLELFERARKIVASRMGDYLLTCPVILNLPCYHFVTILQDDYVQKTTSLGNVCTMVSAWLKHGDNLSNLTEEDSKQLTEFLSELQQLHSNLACKDCNDIGKLFKAISARSHFELATSMLKSPFGKLKKRLKSDADTSRSSASVDPNQEVDVVIFNGLSEKGNFAYVTDEDRWVQLPDLPNPRIKHGLTVHDNKLYLVGGTETSCELSEQRLNLENLLWCKLPPTRTSHLKVEDVCVLDGQLYLLDGRGTVERYNLCTFTWHPVTQFASDGNYRVRGVGHKGKLYIWFTSETSLAVMLPCTTSFSCYDPASNVWESLPPLVDDDKVVKTRDHHELTASDDHVHLVCWSNPTLYVHSYNVNTGTWDKNQSCNWPLLFSIVTDPLLPVIIPGKGIYVFSCQTDIPDCTQTVFCPGQTFSDATENSEKWQIKASPPFTFTRFPANIRWTHARLARNAIEKISELPDAPFQFVVPKPNKR